MSILDKIPSLVGNELFQKLAAIEDITALSKDCLLYTSPSPRD